MPVAVANLSKTVVTLTTGEVPIEWQYAGHPGGDDIQEVPDEVWGSVPMKRMRRKGILTEVDEAEMEAAFERQTQYEADKRSERADELRGVLDTSLNGSVVISEDKITEHVNATAPQRDAAGMLDQATAEAADRQIEHDRVAASAVDAIV